VIHAAQGIVPEIEASPTANEGSVTSIRSEELLRVTKDGDFVLCRTAAPLIQHCLRFIAKGKKATVLGKEIGEGLIGLIETLDCDSIEELLMELADYEQAETERLKKREDRIVELNDTCEVIRALCEDALSIRHVIEKINSLFSKERGPGVTFSTIHKSKGLESDNVYILCPELLPHPRVKVEWMVAQEMNLKYVAITRAKKNLFWVE
jgi:superfamily I DNA/RNA helicase